MFERMHDIFEEEHEPIYFLLSFLFPQNLLPASVLENPIRKAYSDALEMIYNIEVCFLKLEKMFSLNDLALRYMVIKN